MITRFVLLLSLMFATSAHAQWGTGMYGGSHCAGGLRPGRGAVDGGDELANVRGRLNVLQSRIQNSQDRLEHINDDLKKAREEMQRGMTADAYRAVDHHRQFNKSVDDYQGCYTGPSGSAGGPRSDQVLPRGSGANPGGSDKSLETAPPGFCVGSGKNAVNTWAESFANRDGTVNETICDYQVGSWKSYTESGRASRCKRGLRDYYDLMDEKVKLETNIAELDENRRNYERKLRRIDDEIAEGTYCPYCESQRRGYGSSSASVLQSVLPIVGTLMMSGQNRGPSPSPYGRPGWAPYGRPGGYQALPPGGYPGNAYPAQVPGYYGMNNGMYGAVPGGIGQGGFGCQGTSPNYMSDPYAAAPQPFLNGGANPFLNPYQNNLTNPAMQNSMFMPGNGPGFLPILGNGIGGYNPYDPYGGAGGGQGPFGNPFGSPYGNQFANQYQNPFQNAYGNQNQFNPNAPATLPYLGQNPFFQGQNPYGQNPYGQNPYGQNPYGQNPYTQNPYGYNPYGQMPYGQNANGGYPFGGNPNGNPYGVNPYGGGGNPYAPAILPYMNGGTPFGNPYAQGYGNPYGGASGLPYGGGYVNAMNPNYGGGGYPGGIGGGFSGGGALGNFYVQMEQLKQSIQVIQASPIYGGSAPAVLPYLGPSGSTYSSPVYNGGGSVNPYSTGTPNIIRSR